MTSPARKTKTAPLQAYLREQTLTERDLVRLLKRAADQADASVFRILRSSDGAGARVRAAQYEIASAELKRQMYMLWTGTEHSVRQGMHKAAEAAVRAQSDLTRFLTDSVGANAELLVEAEMTAARKRVDYLIGRDRSSNSLSATVYKNRALSSGMVDSAINRGILTGDSAREIASSVSRLIRPDVPGGVSYAAKRLARTELNNAFHATQIITAQATPWVNNVRWNLSGSHPTPDECNDYADRDHGDGPGVWDPQNVPAKPHPQCLCYLTPETISRDEFVRRFATGEFDTVLAGRIGRVAQSA